MIDGYKTALKALWARRMGDTELARHLAKLARKLGVSVPPREIELPALDGFTERDLEGLGIRCRRTSSGLVVIRRVRG